MKRFHYEMQCRAQQAVSKAMRQGRLVRKPCETCGDAESYAHHDSYEEPKWMVVRWLCSKHHHQWHAKNEPVFPEECSIKLEEQMFLKAFKGKRKRLGRPPKPWFRKDRNAWFVVHHGKRYRLADNEADAIAAWKLLDAPFVH